MKYVTTLAIVLLTFLSARSQHLGAYSDFRDRFYVFDRGQHILVEDQKVLEFKIGGTCILYRNSQNRLKLYYEKEVKELEIGGVSAIHATDYLAAYSINQKLKVIEGDKAVTLSYRCPVYQVQDSLIVFYDQNKASLRVYYNGNIEDIENGLMGLPVEYLKGGDNIIAYVSAQTNDFKVLYKGELQTIIRHVGRVSFKVGKDIVAYINELDNSFNVFYKGEMIKLEDFPPKSYRMGDGFVAYVDDMGSFKVFYNEEITEITSYAPESYVCEDNLLMISDLDTYSIFYKGELFEVEPFVPLYSRVDWNTIVFMDATRRLWMYSEGKKKYLVNDVVEDVQVYRDLVVVNLAMNRNLIYYQGEVYEGAAY